MTDLSPLVPLARAVVAAATAAHLRVATAESCTGGLVAAALTEIPGSSAAFECGFVTYSNESKTAMLGVSAALFATSGPGAVSQDAARAMAEGALARSAAAIAVSITGIAGPDGGSAAKPVGLIHFALARRGGETRYLERRFENEGREAIRLAAAAEALHLLAAALGPQGRMP